MPPAPLPAGGRARARAPGRRRHRPDGQRRAGRDHRCARGQPRAPRGRAPAPDAHSARAALYPRRVRAAPASRLLLPRRGDARGLLERRLRPRPQPLLRGPGAPALEHALLAGDRGGDAARPPRSRSASGPTPSTSPRSSAACPSSWRSTRACRGRSASTSCTSRRCSASARPSGRSSRSRPRCPTSATRRSPRASSSASPTARRCRSASGACPTPCSRSCATTATSASTPRRSPTASWTSSSAAW